MAKICFVTSSVFTIGGEQRVTVVLANELAKKHDIVIYTQDTAAEKVKNPYHLSEKIQTRQIMQPEYGILNRILRRIIREINENSKVLYQKKSLYPILEYAYFQKDWQQQLVAEMKKESYDMIVAVSGGNTIRIGLIADQLDCITVGWEHNTYEAYFKTPKIYFWRMDQLFARAIHKLDECVVLNESICRKYKEVFDVDCKVIYNPRSFTSEEKSKLQNKTFVTCGRMIYQKGYDLLIESFKIFAEQEKEWRLVIVGDGEMRTQIEEKIRIYHLENRISITGYQKDVMPYLLDASVYLMPSRWEGFPMVLTEAFEMGLPVVAYDITAVGPLVEDGIEGFVASSFDTADYAEKMLKITGLTQDERRKMAGAAINKAQSLAVENIVLKWEELLGAR